MNSDTTIKNLTVIIVSSAGMNKGPKSIQYVLVSSAVSPARMSATFT